MDSLDILRDSKSFFLLAVSLVIACIYRLRRRGVSTCPLPPGPKPLPIIGNILDLPLVHPWLTYQKWAKTYGDVFFMHLPGRPTIVLNSAKAAFDLLEKRSNIYSDKPYFVMYDLMSLGFSMDLMPYSRIWRKHRRYFHQYFNEKAVTQYLPIQTRETRAFLRRVLESPQDVRQHVRHTFSAIILDIAYGMKVSGMNDRYIKLAQEAVLGASLGGAFGAHWIEFFPFLKYFPSWLPGTRSKKMTEYYRPIVEQMRHEPFERVKQAMAEDTAPPCLATTLLSSMDERCKNVENMGEEEEIIKNVTGVAYAAAADTTTSAAQFFLVAMALNPDIQRKAQAELDSYVGPDRLPEYADYNALTYIRAIVLESMRWMPVLPLGVPHRVVEDDVYNGYWIPKGSVIIANAFSMLHNPVDYPEPEKFSPDRFIKDGRINDQVRDPLTLAFGFGRRICAGRYLSNVNLFLTVASTLHVFDIEPVLGEDGKPLQVGLSTGLVSAPDMVPCRLTPRSKTAEELIRESGNV